MNREAESIERRVRERELKFEVKTEECVREIRPLGFVIEFRHESTVGRFGDFTRYEPIWPESAQISPIQCESARVCAISA